MAASTSTSVQAEDVGEFFDELEKMMSQMDRQPAVAPTGAVEQALAAGEPVARPISPILRVESRTPPPHLTSPHGSPLPRLEGPAIEPEVRGEMLAEPIPGAEPLPEAEPSMRAEPRPSTAEDELPGAAPIVPKAEPPADAAPLPVQPDVDTAAMPPPASSPVSPPTQRQRRRRVPRSPALGEPPRRRRRPSRVIIDKDVQISMEEMRQNIYSMSLEIHKRNYVMTLPKLQSVDVLFRQPGRRLLSDQLLRPWKRIKTMPEPDDLEPLVSDEELIPEPAVAPVVEPAAEPVAEPVAEPAAEPAAEPLVEPASEQLVVADFADRIGEPQEMPSVREEGSLEAPRDPSLQDTSGASADGRAVGKTSMVRVMGGIPEEEPQVQAPGDEEFQLPIPDEQAPLDVPELVPVVPIIPPADHVEDFSEVPPEERSPLSRVWGRLLQFVDEHGMCTLSILVTPDVFNRRTVASTFGALLRLHKRGLVSLSQDQPYGPIVIEVCQQEEGTPLMAYHQNP
nr:translation initiation factor IF-2-like [Rhipicephalus microplus]